MVKRDPLIRCLQMVRFHPNGSCMCTMCGYNFLTVVTLLAANAQSSTGEAVQAPVAGKPVVSMPATNLNIGMDLWNVSPAAAGTAKMRPSGTPSTVVAPAAMIGREGIMSDQWIQV